MLIFVGGWSEMWLLPGGCSQWNRVTYYGTGTTSPDRLAIGEEEKKDWMLVSEVASDVMA